MCNLQIHFNFKSVLYKHYIKVLKTKKVLESDMRITKSLKMTLIDSSNRYEHEFLI